MDQLPNELLLQVAACLPQKDLCSLSLICKKLRPTAQETLFHAPAIPRLRDAKPQRNKLANMLVHIVEQPRLATHMESLAVNPAHDSVLVPTSLTMPTTSMYNLHQHLHSNTKVRVSEYRLVALMMMRAPTLKELGIATFGSNQTGESVGNVNFLERTFGFGASITSLVSVPGFQNLRKLRLDTAFSNWVFYRIPTLEELCLGRSCPLSRPEDNPSSDVKSLTIECGADIMFHPRVRQYRDVERFFQGFDKLEKFSIFLTNKKLDAEHLTGLDGTRLYIPDEEFESPSFYWIRIVLKSLRDSLEHFEMRLLPGEDPSFLRQVAGNFNFNEFERLRHAVLPWDSLHLYADLVPCYLSSIFPTLIEVVDILYSRENILEWVETMHIPKDKWEAFVYLRSINLHFEYAPGIQELYFNERLQKAIAVQEDASDVLIMCFFTYVDVNLEWEETDTTSANPPHKETASQATGVFWRESVIDQQLKQPPLKSTPRPKLDQALDNMWGSMSNLSFSSSVVKITERKDDELRPTTCLPEKTSTRSEGLPLNIMMADKKLQQTLGNYPSGTFPLNISPTVLGSMFAPANTVHGKPKPPLTRQVIKGLSIPRRTPAMRPPGPQSDSTYDDLISSFNQLGTAEERAFNKSITQAVAFLNDLPSSVGAIQLLHYENKEPQFTANHLRFRKLARSTGVPLQDRLMPRFTSPIPRSSTIGLAWCNSAIEYASDLQDLRREQIHDMNALPWIRSGPVTYESTFNGIWKSQAATHSLYLKRVEEKFGEDIAQITHFLDGLGGSIGDAPLVYFGNRKPKLQVTPISWGFFAPRRDGVWVKDGLSPYNAKHQPKSRLNTPGKTKTAISSTSILAEAKRAIVQRHKIRDQALDHLLGKSQIKKDNVDLDVAYDKLSKSMSNLAFPDGIFNANVGKLADFLDSIGEPVGSRPLVHSANSIESAKLLSSQPSPLHWVLGQFLRDTHSLAWTRSSGVAPYIVDLWDATNGVRPVWEEDEEEEKKEPNEHEQEQKQEKDEDSNEDEDNNKDEYEHEHDHEHENIKEEEEEADQEKAEQEQEEQKQEDENFNTGIGRIIKYLDKLGAAVGDGPLDCSGSFLSVASEASAWATDSDTDKRKSTRSARKKKPKTRTWIAKPIFHGR